MKKTLIIIAVVAGYSLFVAALLLSALHPNFILETFPVSKYEAFVILAQLPLISGLAALVSRLLYGPCGWLKRAFKIVVILPIGIVLAPVVLFGTAFLIDYVALWIGSALATVMLAGFMGLVAWIVWTVFRKTANKSVELESARWLDERRSGLTAQDRKWRNRGIRWAVCIPALVVLLIFLFFPEAERMILSLHRGQTVQVGDYSIRTPGSWFIVVAWNNESGSSGMWGLTGLELQHQLGRYMRNQLQLSEWRITVGPSENTLSSQVETPETRRVIPIRDGSLACFEYRQPYHRHPMAIKVKCSGPRGLQASLFGEQRHVAEFYRTLEQITLRVK